MGMTEKAKYPNRVPEAPFAARCHARFEILQPVFYFKRNPQGFSRLRTREGQAITSETRLLQWLSEQSNVSIRTLRRWKARFLSGGIPALENQPRSDKGHSRFFERNPTAATLAEWLYLELRQRPHIVYKSICHLHELLQVPENALPSYETVRARIKNFRSHHFAMHTPGAHHADFTRSN